MPKEKPLFMFMAIRQTKLYIMEIY